MTPEPQTYGFMAELLGLPGAMAALQGRGMRLAALTAAATLVALIVLGTAARRWRPQSGDAGEGSGSEGGGSSAPLDRWQGLAAVALFALAAAARLLHIGAEAISSQEISYIFNAVPPRAPSLLEALLDVSDPNPHTPGFRWAMAWWGRVSTDLGWLRAGPALASAGLAPALHLWLARSGLARAGLAAGVLAALSPLLVFLGRTTMPFGPVVTALALVAWFQDELLRPGGGRWTWPMAVVTAACAWLSYAGGTLLAALLVVGLVQARSPALRRRLGRAWVLAILLGLPLLWQFVSFVALRSELVLSAFADVMARRPPLEALGLFLGVGLERTAGGLGQPGLRAGVLGLAALGGAALGGAVLRRSPLPDSRAAPSLPPSVLALAVGFLGFSVVETVGFALSNGFSYVAIRRFALAATFLLPLAGVGLAWAAERVLGAGWRATGLAVALAALVGGGLPAVLQGQLRPEVRPSIPALLDDLRDGDAVLFGPASFFDSVFWWHYEELGLAPPDHVDGPHFADLETLQGPRAQRGVGGRAAGGRAPGCAAGPRVAAARGAPGPARAGAGQRAALDRRPGGAGLRADLPPRVARRRAGPLGASLHRGLRRSSGVPRAV